MNHVEIAPRALQLAPDALGLFCLLAAERLQPVYLKFATAFALDEQALPALHQQLFECLANPCAATLVILSAQVQGLIPDTEEFSDVLADQAQCAAICTSYCVDFLATGDKAQAAYALQKVEEALDIYGYEGGALADALAHEQAWQQHLLQRFEQRQGLSAHDLPALRKANAEHPLPQVPGN